MCGILGKVGGAPCDTAAFDVALDLLAHRGPDDRGVYCNEAIDLGHRRLAIIDLTTSGHQPMVDVDAGLVIVFNGEIYNYPALKSELESRGHRFGGHSDTEVLLAAYRQWGRDCLNRLNGMWAFAVWHTRERKLFMARDRFGVKPFYYARPASGGLVFASEPKAIVSLNPEFRQVNEGVLYGFLSEGKLYDNNHAFFAGIELLPPAHYGEFDLASGSLRVDRYWNYPAQTINRADDAIDEFDALFNDAVAIRLRSDVPVGVTLSGGLDSTAVLAGAMATRGERIDCFTSVYSASDRGEAGWAEKACAPYGFEPVAVEAGKQDWAATLNDISWHMDAPGYSPAVYPLWFLMRQARQQGVPVLLEGQGADEELGGYPQYGVLALIERLSRLSKQSSGAAELRRMWTGLTTTFSRRWVLLWLIRELNPWAIAFYRKRVGAATTLRTDFEASAASRYARPAQLDLSGHGRVDGRLLLDHARDILPGLLHYGDAISMAHSVESRLPFMDYRLVEWLFARNSEIKIAADGSTKWVLREYLKQIGQQRIAARPDKLGYPTPVEHWLAEDNGAVARDTLLAGNAAILQYCRREAIEQMIDDHCRGRQGVGNHLYRLVSTEFWLQRCVLLG